MEQRQKEHLLASRALRVLAALAGAGVLLTGAGAACGTSDEGTGPPVDPGATFGAEVVVNVIGAGRVTTSAGDISCPGACFTRVLVADGMIDGGLAGLTLVGEATPGFHFDHWRLEAAQLGVHSRGPEECSPMRRATVTDVLVSTGFDVLGLPFGETIGTPPAGFEATCADFTKVPLAYSVTAFFVEDPQEPMFDASMPPTIPPLFEPAVGSGPARDIGVAGGLVYWLFDADDGSSNSGIAAGSPGASTPIPIVAANGSITSFDVDTSLVYQRNGILEAVYGGTTSPVLLQGAPFCAAVASDSSYAYCRSNSGTTSYLYSWPISGGTFSTLVHTLPYGTTLAVDESFQRVFFSDESSGSTSSAIIDSVARTGDGGAPIITQLVFNQSGPHALTVGNGTNLFWLDDRGGGTWAASWAPKSVSSVAQTPTAGATVRYIAADPTSTAFWIANSDPQQGQASILRATAISGSLATSAFLANLDSVNGLAVDSTYVYWTQNDGRVYRAPKFAGGGGD